MQLPEDLQIEEGKRNKTAQGTQRFRMAVDYRLVNEGHNQDFQGSGDLMSSGLKASTRASRNFISTSGLRS
jgi:hypothetical protein